MKRCVLAGACVILACLATPSLAMAGDLAAKLGFYSPAAVRAFQARHGLTADGIVGHQTATCARGIACHGVPIGPLTSADHQALYGGARLLTSRSRSPSITSNPAPTVHYSGGAPPESVAQCESGGNPRTNTGNGFYGKWQFTDATWHAVTGLPGHASDYSEATQDAGAAKLWRGGAGAGNWPVCGSR